MEMDEGYLRDYREVKPVLYWELNRQYGIVEEPSLTAVLWYSSGVGERRVVGVGIERVTMQEMGSRMIAVRSMQNAEVEDTY
jgi:hypothetical protein